jgi:enoyl-CoA hydratase/carnithine racemase
MTYATILFEVADHVATVTLNRPDRLNAFNQQMCVEFGDVWKRVREEDDIHVSVVRANGKRAFCTGVDVVKGISKPPNFWVWDDPGKFLGPKANDCWKPMVIAINGMCAGGAFYWVNEADIVICDESATFFDPHVSYGMASALEPMGLARRIPLGEVLRWALLGLDERMSARRALEIGLVSEIVPDDDLRARAAELAATIAHKPTVATQGTVRAIWDSLDMTRSGAQATGLVYTQLANPIGQQQVDRASFTKPKWRLR